ncbi:hypothetical protein SAMN05421743_109160 [Thalassobacillus cyri]|uniref:Serine/threonine protein kinase n=1 Tax=Thalassobacillus cyri TaxID=571932 RepID=A0A1H4ENN9_9BACI|nr:serine/threonine protein kinase [Thalassobacillus cyri]SEA86517.1 hypothetical protein SAMN05421743_109160 [Thalassobacillus cyri]
MSKDWHAAASALSNIKVSSSPGNNPVAIQGNSQHLKCIGVGTDAAVFRHKEVPSVAFKLYAGDKLYKKDIEQQVYEKLSGIPNLSKLYDTGNRYLVLRYEPGPTLYDCLLQGIHIPLQAIQDVEETRNCIKKYGLNPRDIHLKNILLQNGRAKILDVSEYINPGNDYRWEHLKKGYDAYYHYIDGKPVPFWLLDTIQKWYNHSTKDVDTIDEFMKKISKLTLFWK